VNGNERSENGNISDLFQSNYYAVLPGGLWGQGGGGGVAREWNARAHGDGSSGEAFSTRVVMLGRPVLSNWKGKLVV